MNTEGSACGVVRRYWIQEMYNQESKTASESGGIGRRARLRIWFRKEWGFESPLSHHLKIRETAVLSWSSKFRREVVLVATVVLLEFHLTPLEVAPIPARRKWMVS